MADLEIIFPRPTIFRAVRLESFMPRASRMLISKILFLVSVFFLIVYIMGGGERALGFFLIFFSFFWVFWLLDFYFLVNSRAAPFLIKKSEEAERVYFLDFGGARRAWYLSLFDSENIDLAALYDFFKISNSMKLLPLRLGVDPEFFGKFIDGRRVSKKQVLISRPDALGKLTAEADLKKSETIGAGEFIMLLFDLDGDFKKFLFDLKIRDKELRGAINWIAGYLEHQRKFARWWEREVLGRVPGIGKNLSFGFTYNLDKYSRDVSIAESAGVRALAHEREISAIEEILSKSSEANVLLIGEEGAGKHTILLGLARMIWEGRIMPALEHKRMVMLDTPAITSYAKSKSILEEVLIKIMNEAVTAGNIILVIDNFAEFLESASAFSVDIPSLMEPYFGSSFIQIIAIADQGSFHRILETNGKIMKLFQKVEVPEPGRNDTILILENAAELLERGARATGIVVTYQAVEAAYELADRFVAEGAMPEKAIDLLDTAISSLGMRSGSPFLTAEDIERVVEESTKIPLGKVGKEEQQKLLNLEEFLHRRIVGQDEAVKAVANAMRRLRAGLHAGKRPIGSFLFLGPTGVGKTETAKALAEAYFGSEKNMTRFDMSEFQEEEGLKKLIGSFTARDQGVLANALREKPFSVLLFDEFEKSSKAVVNLFLQILDEGFFTDAFGKKVSVRDAMVIATSNAGSNLIWDLLTAGKDPASLQKEVIDAIRKEGVFSPEILNRFDAVVVFHPLKTDQLQEIAKLLLEELARRLKEKDISFVITEKLISKVAGIGYDPVMGARPMRRAITDRVEQAIAKKILENQLPRGSIFEFSQEELKNL